MFIKHYTIYIYAKKGFVADLYFLSLTFQVKCFNSFLSPVLHFSWTELHRSLYGRSDTPTEQNLQVKLYSISHPA